MSEKLKDTQTVGSNLKLYSGLFADEISVTCYLYYNYKAHLFLKIIKYKLKY